MTDRKHPDWATPPTPKYETPQDQLPPQDQARRRTPQPESPSLGKRYVPGSASSLPRRRRD